MLKHKGDVSLNGSYANTDDAHGLGLQAAVAVDSSLALMTSFYSLKNNQNTDWQGRGRYFEMGIGKYGAKRNSNFVYDVFAGVGFGRIDNNNGAGSSLSVNFAKPFVQGSVGFTTKWVEVAFTPRFALPIYTSHQNKLTDAAQHDQTEIYFKHNKNQFVFEPGITFRFGYENVKANLNFCASTFTLDEQYSDVNINNLYLGLGISALISKRYEYTE
jgi:hypothetical protein